MDGISRSCPACRAELREGARFCPRCGQQVTLASASPAPSPLAVTPPNGTPALSAPPAVYDERRDWYPSTVPRPGYPPQPAPPPGPAAPSRSPQPAPQSPYRAALPTPAYQPPPGDRPPPAYGQQPTEYRPLTDYGPPSDDEPPPGYGPPPSQPPGAGAAPQGGGPQGYAGFEPFRPYPPPATSPLRDDRDSSRGPLALLVILVLLVVGGGTYALVAQPWKSHETLRDTASTGSAAASRPDAASASAAVSAGSSQAPTPAAGATASAAGTAPAAAEQTAATSVATMLARSVSARTAITAAYNDVDACGPNLAADAKAFTAAANSRRTLLSHLATMPGRASLPPALLADLTSAWQASIAADQDYVRWTNDEIAQGCVTDDTSDPGFQAAGTPNSQATADKQAFASAWNPIAARYGLSRYQAGQL